MNSIALIIILAILSFLALLAVLTLVGIVWHMVTVFRGILIKMDNEEDGGNSQ
jgi:hypothetical protein